MGSSKKTASGRWLAYQALELWEHEGVNADAALDRVCGDADPRERGLALELTLGVLRWRSRLDELLGRLLRQPLAKLHPAVHGILRLGLYQLRSMNRIPARAVVHEAVEMCRLAGIPWATGLVNGVLRRFDRERDFLEAVPAGSSLETLAHRWAHPVWLVRQMQAVGRGDLEDWLKADNSVPPLTLRANSARVTRDQLHQRLKEAGATVRDTAISPEGLVVESGGSVTGLPGYAEGWFAVQDEASQLVGLIVGAQPGDTVLDACSAPGGKTLHLAAKVGGDGHVFATDASRERLKRVAEALHRLQPGPVTLLCYDWAQSAPAELAPHLRLVGRSEAPPREITGLPTLVDRALVDAPCSGFGVIWRKPEIKWRRKAEEATHYPARQRTILEAVADRVRPGGTLVYSVCTPLIAEGPAVVEAFLADRPDYRLVDLKRVLDSRWLPVLTPEGYLRTFPDRHGCDAFFAARLERC